MRSCKPHIPTRQPNGQTDREAGKGDDATARGRRRRLRHKLILSPVPCSPRSIAAGPAIFAILALMHMLHAPTIHQSVVQICCGCSARWPKPYYWLLGGDRSDPDHLTKVSAAGAPMDKPAIAADLD